MEKMLRNRYNVLLICIDKISAMEKICHNNIDSIKIAYIAKNKLPYRRY